MRPKKPSKPRPPEYPECPDPSAPCAATPKHAGAISAIVRELAVELQLPDVVPRFGPDPAENEWGMLPVGYPVWLWTDGPTRRTATASAYGLTFQLSATWQSTSFAMGDGHSVTCTATKRYTRAVTPGAPSPVCGYSYREPSLPGGQYQVTATATWMVNWSVDGMSGAFPLSYSDSARLPIGDLHALNR